MLESLISLTGVTHTVQKFSQLTYNRSRKYIASFPDNILAECFTASIQGSLNLNAMLCRTGDIIKNTASIEGDVGSLTLISTTGKLEREGPILYTGQAWFVSDGDKSPH